MPQRKSAKKELRKNIKRRGENLKLKRKIRATITKLKKSIENKNFELLRQALKDVYQTLDKAAAKKIIHQRNAARKKSRLASLVNKQAGATDKRRK